MRHVEKISQLLGVKKPKKMRKGSCHEDLERDGVALAKLVMKEGKKPGKFLLPHGIILLFWCWCQDTFAKVASNLSFT